MPSPINSSGAFTGLAGRAQTPYRIEHRARLKEAGLKNEESKRVIDPMESFRLQLREEVESYERLKRREFYDLEIFVGSPFIDLGAHGARLARAVKIWRP